MKKTFTKIMLLLFVLVVGIGNAVSQSTPYYTLDTEATGNTGSNSSYTSTGDVTVGVIKWYATGNLTVQPWRLGGKASKTSTTATLVVNRPVYTDDEMDEKIESIKLYIGDVTVNTFTSVTLTVASTTSFSGDDIIDEITNSSPSANSTLTFTPTSGSYWNEDSFYKFTITATLKGKSNTYVQFKKVEFFEYTSSGGDPIQLSAPSLTAVQSPGKVTLTWDAVSNASSYTIQYADNLSFTGATTENNATSPKEITGLTNGTTYYFKAMSVGNGTTYTSSEYGDAVSATPTSVQLTAPTLTATPGNEKVTLTWSSVSNASSYTIQYADNPSFTGATTVNNANSPKEITGLTNGTAYYFKAMSVGDGTNYTSSDYGSAVSTTPANIATITITQDNLTDFTNSYDWYNWSSGGVSGQAYAYKNSGMQFNSGKDAYWIYNSSAIPGTITSVKMTKASGATDRDWYLKAGTSSITTTSGGTQIGNNSQTVGTDGATWSVSGSYNYFLLYVTGGATVISSIEITYIPSTDPSITAEDVNIAYNANGNISYTLTNPKTGGVLTAAITEGNTENWLSIGDPSNSNASGTVALTCKSNTGAERTATVTLTYTYGNSKTQITKEVLVTQLAPPQTYTLATSIENGKHYIITNGNSMIMGSQGSNNRTAVDVLEDGYYDNVNNEYTIPSDAGIYEFVINGPDADGYYTIHDANVSSTGYLYAAGDGDKKNYLRTQAFNDNNGRWSISINSDNTDDNYGKVTIIAQGTNSNKYMRFNSTLFSCYAEGSSVTALPYLYVRNDSNYEFYMDIAKYTTPSAGDPVNGWHFIASPLASAYQLSESNLVAGTYDLYRLNNTTWENHKNNAHDDFTALVNGQGYLYANSANTTLHFSGAINAFTTAGDANQKVYSEGWNLIGNPYNIPVYINKPYYTLNADGTAIVAIAVKNVAIAPCTGVIADGGTIIFTQASQSIQAVNNGNLQMTLAHNVATRDGASVSSTIDNAIVSFNEDSQLEKFYFGEPEANIFLPQNGEDYAIAFSNRQGDMPLNFKTTETGSYTISLEGNNMDLRGIYLIDMLAGQEIDLSVNPSYTFIGSPVDQAERFKIVFRGVGNSGNDIFAYQNGNDIIVSGEGELQIFDVTGRSVMTTTVNGVETINVPTMGVYIFRLNEKVQKIVVR